MSSWEQTLANPPAGKRALELWLQHAAGFILFEDVRRYAIGQIDRRLPAKARAAARKGIDDALYGLMQVIDGVSGGIANPKHEVSLEFLVRLAKRADGRVASEMNLRNGDGMCMGYHGWRRGDFGDAPIVAKARRAKPRGGAKKRSSGRRRK